MKKQFNRVFLLLIGYSMIFFSCTQKGNNGVAEINGTSIYYESKGQGTPLIFLHGFACDNRNWSDQVDYFSKNYRVITYDLRGFGKSALPDTSVTYSHKDDLEALLDYLQIQKAVIVGHSLGGKAAFQIAFENPERVLALILPEGGPYYKEIWQEPFTRDFINMFVKVSKIAKEEGIEKGKLSYLSLNINEPALKNSVSKEMTKKMVMDYSGWHWQNKDPEINQKPISMQEFSKVNVPTLLMQGELSGEFYSYTLGKFNQYIPDSKYVKISNSGHMLNLENPEQFNYEVLTFLKKNDIK